MPCDRPARYPCGKCPGCGSARASDWSIRLAHEYAYHESASFVTLTYASDPVHVDKIDCQLWLKRLRRELSPKRLRYYLVSEYGTRRLRPHYHAIIFGHDFSVDPGATLVRPGLYTSPTLEKSWPQGHVSSGSVTAASIRYVANYSVSRHEEHDYTDLETGDPVSLVPTFSLMSRNPGIGARWIDEHAGETYKDDTVQLDGFSRRPPRYYDARTFGCDPASKENLRLIRAGDKRRAFDKNPQKYYINHSPDKKAAQAKINAARRGLKKQGDI